MDLNQPVEYVFMQEMKRNGVPGQFCRVPTAAERTPAAVMRKLREMGRGKVSVWVEDGVIRYSSFPKSMWLVLYNGVLLKKDAARGGVP